MEEDCENTDLTLVCRTCLSSKAKFYPLEAPLPSNEDTKTTLMESLRFCCSQFDDAPELPSFMCTLCIASLKVAYGFIRQTRAANEVLKQNLLLRKSRTGNLKRKRPEEIKQEPCPVATTDTSFDRPMRCRMCGEKLHTKRALKEHVKLHMDMFSFSCGDCNEELNSKEELQKHYMNIHGIQPTPEMLKPRKNVIKKENIKTENIKTENIKTETPASEEDEASNSLFTTNLYETQPPQKKLCLSEQLCSLDGLEEHNSNPMEGITTTITELTDLNNITFSNLTANESLQLSTANEFVVRHDGSLSKTENDVVIEYINAADGNINLNNAIFFNNSVQFNPSDAAFLGMDFDDMIIEESVDSDDLNVIGNVNSEDQVSTTATTLCLTTTSVPTTTEGAATITTTIPSRDRHTKDFLDTEVKPIPSAVNIEDLLPPPIRIETAPPLKKSSCKICSASFASQELLKTHMLSHNGIPHFFCDKCPFYTFFKVDFTQHYKAQHQMWPSARLLQPRNKTNNSFNSSRPLYSCDHCLFETNVRGNLRRHYLSYHKEEATDVQLRPSVPCGETFPVQEKKTQNKSEPDYPAGAQCKKCNQVFHWRENMRQHYSEHMSADRNMNRLKQKNALQSKIKVQPQTLTPPNVQIQSQLLKTPPRSLTSQTNSQMTPSHFHEPQQAPSLEPPSPILQRDDVSNIVVTAGDAISSITLANNFVNSISNATENSTPIAMLPHDLGTVVVPSDSLPFAASTVVMTNDGVDVTSATLLDNVVTMSNFVTTPAVADKPTSDVVAVIASAVNEGIDFDFNGDALFEDFDDEDDDDEHDQRDLDHLQLTTDEENDEIEVAEDENEKQLNCMHCDKRFTSQYQFENHMFMHRGLAPYRCEMCTNLYNAKRPLINHYRLVHKKDPTRDMIQAKGDKVDKMAMIPSSSLELQRTKTFMCAKCPYESTNIKNLLIHLTSGHGLHDKKFILQKLPFECPRCVRSFSNKTKLMIHLEHNHAEVPITSPKSAEHRRVNSNNNNNANSTSLLKNPASSANTSTSFIIPTQGIKNNDEEEKGTDVITESTAKDAEMSKEQEWQQQQQVQVYTQLTPCFGNISTNQTLNDSHLFDNMINLEQLFGAVEEIEIETETESAPHKKSELGPIPTPPTSVEENDRNSHLNTWEKRPQPN